ncbi:ERAP1-like C-terminal domain-containing protein [bacterium]|nr:ERAP1-like C-terminal domain-containing protein [bacterium]
MSDRDFRLSPHVRPVRYDLAIEVDLDHWRFHGVEEIELTVGEPTASVTLHASELAITSARAVLLDGTQLAAHPTYNATAETATLTFPRALPRGTVRLSLDFRGEILARLRGFYRSTKDGARYAATQFEAADARRAFPCFDEPAFKARFALTLDIPSNLVAIANGPVVRETDLGGGRKEVEFAETPPISSYLVAYTVGPYEATPVTTTSTGWPVRVFLPRGMAAKGVFARDAHARSLEYLEDYTAIPYPYTKVDAIGVPDFEAGAMENPGAITYRLTAIAADAERASTPSLKGIYYTAAHELTHMWWGDLVTMAWWDDLWLNESFATFIGYKVVADLVPEWGMWRDFVATLVRPFNLDALASTHPISFEVKNAKQATERFDVITYWKGAGVVRMIEGFLGADAFRAGVRAYLTRYREANATADDFWRELGAASGRDVATIANAWITQPGHPLLRFSSANGRLEARQQRFFADPDAPADPRGATWPTPLVIKHGRGDQSGETRVLLDGATQTIELPEHDWFFPNGDGAGFFRFALDDAALHRLVQVVQSALNPAERLTLVGNQWALVRACKADVAQFFSMLAGFRAEPDRAVLSAIAERLYWLATHVVDDATRPLFERFVGAFVRPHFDALGWNPRQGESADDRLRRATAIAALGELAADPAIIDAARARLERYLAEPTSLDANLASAVVTIAARRGDAALYQRYLERKRAAGADPEEEQRFLLGLAAFEDPELIGRSLAMTLTDEVRPQDRAHLYARLLGMRAARLTTWTFIRDRWQALTANLDPMLQQNIVRALAQLTPADVADEVLAFLPPRATEETRETVAQTIEQLRIDAAVAHRLTPAVSAALRDIA